jgi:Fibronectin type III domain
MRGILILFTLAGLLFFTKANAQTEASVTLSWTPSSSSDVAGYYIYYWTNSYNITTNVVPVPGASASSVTINGLPVGMTYYFCAASYDSSYNVSTLSPTISGVVGSSSSSAASLTSALMSSSHQFGFTISGVSSGQYIVQASTDLVNWVSLLTNSGAPFNFVDSNTSQFSHRFYRTAYIPPN